MFETSVTSKKNSSSLLNIITDIFNTDHNPNLPKQIEITYVILNVVQKKMIGNVKHLQKEKGKAKEMLEKHPNKFDAKYSSGIKLK